jgi:RNA-splicing ligase RtcB
MITGKDLIEMGYKEGKWFKEALTFINRYKLNDSRLRDYLESLKPDPTIDLHEQAIPFYENITAANDLERDNVDAVKKSMQMVMKTPTVVAGAIMPDACPAGPSGTIPVGGVVVTKNSIHPGMHSADICCSVMLTNLGNTDPEALLNIAQSVTHFGPGGRPPSKDFNLPEDLKRDFLQNSFLKGEESLVFAAAHLGTQGDGNHFLYIGRSRNSGDTMLITHHGSRGAGALLYKNAMLIAEKFRKKLSPQTSSVNAWIPFDSPEGQQYWLALQIIRKWTKLNHTLLHDAIIQHTDVEVKDRYWNEHNFVFRDDDLFYHAKGATPMDPKFLPDVTGPRIIPLNMGEPVLLAEGTTGATNLGFAPHGAGRNMSRSKHIAGKNHLTTEQIFKEETKGIDARFFYNEIDISELPSAYKSAADVKAQIRKFDLATIVDEIHPFGCIMAGDWQKNAPWRKKKKK